MLAQEPLDPEIDPVREAKAIIQELRKYDEALYRKPRWLVLNKMDLVPEEERDQRRADFIAALGWDGPVFTIAAITGGQCKPLVYAIMEHLDTVKRTEDPHADEPAEAAGDTGEADA